METRPLTPANATRRRALGLALAFGLATPALQAQDSFPAPGKPIRLIIPFAAGSGTDNSARNFIQRVSQRTGWNFIIDNKPGGNSFIGLAELLKAPADGYTMVYTGGTTHGVNSALFKKLPYDPVEDFTPITPAAFSPMVLLAKPALKVGSAAELTQLIRQNPGKFSAATGSNFQVLAAELYKHQAGLQFQTVAYKGSAQSMTDLIGGHVDFTFVDAGAAMPQVKAGTLKPLAITAGQRLAALPQVPTMAEAGLPDIRLNGWAALFVKKGTPPAAVETLRKAFVAYFESPEYRQYIAETGGYHETMSAEQITAYVRSEIARAQDTFRRAGIQPE